MRRRLLVLGGGFYGAAIAAHRGAQGDHVVLLEAQPDLMTGASAFNQARVHGGYHYPRALTTAARSQANYEQFVEAYSACIVEDFVSLYAIARSSKTTTRKFRRLCDLIGAPLHPAPPALRRLFASQTVDAIWQVREAAFDCDLLRTQMWAELAASSVEVRLSSRVAEIVETETEVIVRTISGDEHRADGAIVSFYGESAGTVPPDAEITDLQFEPCEVAIVDVPEELRSVGITVMDGPFFSLWPFPTEGLHSLTHVRYTPHGRHGTFEHAQSAVLGSPATRAERMIRDAGRYVPAIREATVQRSLWGVKTIPARREGDDARPILIKTSGHRRVMSVLGSKLDNVRDALVVSDAHSEALAAGAGAGGSRHG